MKQQSKYDERTEINIRISGKLKDELIRRACRNGFNNECSNWLQQYLKKQWKVI